MATTQGTHDWAQRRSWPTTPEEEAQLLTEILDASENAWLTLEQLARARECPALFRCAAIDRYVELRNREAKEVLDELTDFAQEPNEDVRTVAYQWLASLEPHRAVRVRGGGTVRTRGRRRLPAGAWREQAAGDPSPQVQWLAALGDE